MRLRPKMRVWIVLSDEYVLLSTGVLLKPHDLVKARELREVRQCRSYFYTTKQEALQKARKVIDREAKKLGVRP